MTHKEQVLERALENLLGRIARGQEYPVAEWSVVQLYGVAQEDLMEAYDDFCCVGNSVSDKSHSGWGLV